MTVVLGMLEPGERRGRIVRRYFLVFAVLVDGSLVTSAVLEMAWLFRETHRG